MELRCLTIDEMCFGFDGRVTSATFSAARNEPEGKSNLDLKLETFLCIRQLVDAVAFHPLKSCICQQQMLGFSRSRKGTM